MDDTIFLFQYVVCIAFSTWCYIWCSLLIYYMRCTVSFLCIFRLGSLGGVTLASSGSDRAGGGNFRVLDFVVVTLG